MENSIPHGQVDGEQLLDLDMKKFRQEKQEVCNNVTITSTSTYTLNESTINVANCFLSTMMQVVVESVEDFLENFECVGSFSQDKKEPNSIVVPGCPPLLDWRKMEAEEGEITLVSVLVLGHLSISK